MTDQWEATDEELFIEHLEIVDSDQSSGSESDEGSSGEGDSGSSGGDGDEVVWHQGPDE